MAERHIVVTDNENIPNKLFGWYSDTMTLDELESLFEDLARREPITFFAVFPLSLVTEAVNVKHIIAAKLNEDFKK